MLQMGQAMENGEQGLSNSVAGVPATDEITPKKGKECSVVEHGSDPPEARHTTTSSVEASEEMLSSSLIGGNFHQMYLSSVKAVNGWWAAMAKSLSFQSVQDDEGITGNSCSISLKNGGTETPRSRAVAEKSLHESRDIHASSKREDQIQKNSARSKTALRSQRLVHHHHHQRRLSTWRRMSSKGKVSSAKYNHILTQDEISEFEEDAFSELRTILLAYIADVEYLSHGTLSFTPESEEAFKANLMSEHTLRRFLIARNWDVQLAAGMLIEYYRWRDANPLGSILRHSIQTSLAAKKVYMLKETDWSHRPILVVMCNRHVVDKQSVEETVRFVQYCTDKIMDLALDDDKGITKMCVFCDLRSVGTHCLDKTALASMLELMTNYFPERLGTAILWKPPTIFYIAWKLLHNLVPSETRRRMCFAYKQKDVNKFMDPAFVPKMLGGTADDDILIPIEEA